MMKYSDRQENEKHFEIWYNNIILTYNITLYFQLKVN